MNNDTIREEDGWYVLGEDEIYFKFCTVSPFMFNTLEDKILMRFEESKPIAPLLQQGSVTRQNEADGVYQDKLAIWNRVSEIVNNVTASDIAIAAGVVLRDPIPDTKEWLPEIERQLSIFDINIADVGVPYMSESFQHEFLYKKYVVLASDLAMTLFKTFFDKDAKKALATLSQAVNMFRPNKESETVRQGEDK